MTRQSVLLLLGLPLAGCAAESNLFQDKVGAADTGDWADTSSESQDDSVALRLDVYPSSAGPALEPQSVTLDDDTTDIAVRVEEPTTVWGLISGYKANAPSAVSVPGEDVPVVAEVRLTHAGSVAGAATMSAADGTFNLTLTPGQGYTFSVVPLDPADLPFLVATDLSIDEDQRLDDDLLDLGYGVPVYGLVLKSDGTPVPRASVSLVDLETGVVGPATATDGIGYYQLRALPGLYTLVVAGRETHAEPTVSVEIEVGEEDGARVDVDMGDYEAVSFDCIVVDAADGEPVEDVTVRFTAVALADPDWSLTRETETDSKGSVSPPLLPGRYEVEFIPPYDSNLSPVSLELDVGNDGLNLTDPVELPPFTTLSSHVVDPQGQALSNVIVTAGEIGFNGDVWWTTTDGSGLFTLDVPTVPLTLTFTPANGAVAIKREALDPSTDGLGEVVLSYGQAVTGSVRTSGGESVPYAVIELRDAESNDLLGTTLTDEEGNFSARVEP